MGEGEGVWLRAGRILALSRHDDKILREPSGDVERPAHPFERLDQKLAEVWKEPARSRKVAVRSRIQDLKSLLFQNFRELIQCERVSRCARICPVQSATDPAHWRRWVPVDCADQ